jgi:hypothetical protein
LGQDIFYEIPIQVQIIGGTRDTVITLNPTSSDFNADVYIDFNPQYVRIDPFSHIIQKTDNSTFALGAISGLVSDIMVGTAYPNPAKNYMQFVISLNHSNEVHFTVYDMSGKQLYKSVRSSFPTGESTLEWHFEGLSNGVYLLKIEIGDRIFYRSATILK